MRCVNLNSNWPVIVLAVGWLAAVSAAHAEQLPFGKGGSYLERLEREVSDGGVELDLGSLLEALAHHSDWSTRSAVAMLLGLRGEAEAVGGLLQAARTADSWAVRRNAAVALHSLGQPEGLEILRHEMREESPRFPRFFAARTLAQLGDSSGYGVVKEALKEGLHAAIDGLGEFLRFEELDALDVLIDLAHAEEANVRRQARMVLSQGVQTGLVERGAVEDILQEPPEPSAEEIQETVRTRRERVRLKLETLEADPTEPNAEAYDAKLRKIRLEMEALLKDPTQPEEVKDHARDFLLMLKSMETKSASPGE